MSRRSLYKIFKKYVRHTTKDYHVAILTDYICNLLSKEVFVSTRVIKHAYDKRTAQEFDFLIRHLKKIMESPDEIYKNKDGKTGDICVTKTFDCGRYICVLEKTTSGFEVVTFFRIDFKYTNSYELLWKRRAATPHRNR